MTTLVLGLAGQALGEALLPAGLTVLGQTISGATIGGAVGALAGAYVDGMLRGSARVEGPRLTDLHVQASTPGAALPRCWGAMRVAGQVIWATRYRENEARSGGGKSGPRVTQYRYSVSFAVALCEGVIGGIGRVWADGKALTLDGVTMRVHRGTEGQPPDPLIEAVEGAGAAPAYRGTAYVVFEDMALEPFGNRVPQLSFEVMKPVAAEDAEVLANVVEAVCLIPGAGEFALATGRVLRDEGRGRWAAENVNNRTGRPDIEASLDQLQAQLPHVRRVALVVSWFGDDLRAGSCRIRPGVELNAKRTRGGQWEVAGISRGEAYQVSQTEGRPNYGGTPSDESVAQAIRALKARGMEVTLYPFVMMDVPPGNALPDPHGGAAQGAFPWRGRITCHPAPGRPGSPDGTGAAADQIDALFAGEWGLRRMILHYAHLAAAAGGVDAFLIGSEMRGATTVRAAEGVYPAVGHLKTLAADVRAILGPGARLSYAADWTEWRGHDRMAESGAFHFHLDPLWADENVDFIGVDLYAPLADWRDGAAHLDHALSPTGSVYDRAYLMGNIEGGEDHGWFYADEAARIAQARTPISDGAYGKPWMFRAKDFRGWWSNPHVNREGGVETSATAWVPRAKPFVFTELGCPAVDKGANQPNVFHDPKSSESALPRFSTGARDDLMQARAIEAVIGYWRDPARNPVSPVYGGPMVAAEKAHVWAWDARPFPDWPLREAVWSDGPLWRTGHWLNGRAGAAPLGALVREICAYAGLDEVDVTGLRGACAGYVIDRPMSAREALQPLMEAYAFDAAESGGAVRFFHRGDGAATILTADDLALADADDEAGPSIVTADPAELPGAVKLSHVDAGGDYQTAAVEARGNGAATRRMAARQLAVSLSRAEAQGAAARALQEAWCARESARFALPPSRIALEAGDAVRLDVGGRLWEGRATRTTGAGLIHVEAGRLERWIYAAVGAELEGAAPPPAAVFGPAHLLALDLGAIAFGETAEGLRLAAFGDPWPGSVSVARGVSAEGPFTEVARLTRRAAAGETTSALRRGAPHRWDRLNTLDVTLYGGALASAGENAVLDGANRIAVETAPGQWEAIQFREAALVAPATWRLSGLLRGQAGTEGAIVDESPTGARVLALDGAAVVAVSPEETGTLHLRSGPPFAAPDDPAVATDSLAYEGRGRLPWSPCHARARREGDGAVRLRWIRRARDDAGRWTEHEVSLDEDRELYRVDVMDGAAVKRRVEVEAPAWRYDAAMQAADWGGAAPSPLRVEIAQISPRFGAGAVLRASLKI